MLLIKMSSPDIVSSLGETTWLENFINSAVVLSLLKTTEPPKDDGGAAVTKYVVELSEGLTGES